MRKTPMVLAMGLVTLFSLISIMSAIAENSISGIVAKKATEHNIPVAFALSIVKVESNFNPTVRGKHGEYGLGQIKCSTAKGYGFKGDCKKLLDTETNLEYSFKYLKAAIDIANGDLCRAAVLYNEGFNSNRKKSSYCKKVISLMS